MSGGCIAKQIRRLCFCPLPRLQGSANKGWFVTERDEQWHRIEQLCQAALDRPLDQRAAFLATACGDDVVLRNEVDALLSQEPALSGFLMGSLAAVSTTAVQIEVQSLTGRRVLGSTWGLCSAVGAWETSTKPTIPLLGRDVAIKVLRSEIASDPDRIATRCGGHITAPAQMPAPATSALRGDK